VGVGTEEAGVGVAAAESLPPQAANAERTTARTAAENRADEDTLHLRGPRASFAASARPGSAAGFYCRCCLRMSRISVSRTTSGGVAAAGAKRAASRLKGMTTKK